MRGKLNETSGYNYRYTCISLKDHHEHHGIFFTVDIVYVEQEVYLFLFYILKYTEVYFYFFF